MYSGEWTNGMINGYCEMVFTEGKIYYGYASKDKKEGFGVYYTPSPLKIYVGFWKNNKQDGVGKLITEKSSKYGFWNQGERLNWLDSYSAAVNKLGSEKLKYKELLKIEITEITKVINQISK